MQSQNKSAEDSTIAKPIYLDHHATTPCDPEVVKAMIPYLTDHFGNAASRSHAYGWAAKEATEVGREQVAELIGATPREIIFTSGATESDNAAVKGVAEASLDKGKHIITSCIEHKAVLDSCASLEAKGWEVTYLPVDSAGRLTAEAVARAIREDTTLCSIMWANNEVGVIQPIQEISAACRERGVWFHTDAAQALGRIPIDVSHTPVDLMSISAHKMYGPKGIGALYVRRGRPRVPLSPLIDGGGHERGLRSGTLPVHQIVGFGHAATLAKADLQEGEVARIERLRDRLWAGIQAGCPNAVLNGTWDNRLPNNLNCSVPGVEAEALMMGLRAVACSSGSACTSATLEPSYVLRAMGIPPAQAHASIRFGLGRTNTADEIEQTIALVVNKVSELRRLSERFELDDPPEQP